MRIFHLSFLLDYSGYNRIDLVSFYELSKLDDFIMERFKNTKDVRKKYDANISEFCLENMDFIKNENKKNKRNWTGSIAIICEERDKEDKTLLMYKIPIIYQDDKKMLSKEECLNKIKERLKDKKIVGKIFNEKRYLLSDYEKDLLIKDYNRSDNKYLKSFVGNFYNRLKRCQDDELLYFYCRALMHVCGLNELSIKTKFGNISHVDKTIPHNTEVVKKTGFSKDEYFNTLIDEERYDELFNIYSADEIIEKSNVFTKGKKR